MATKNPISKLFIQAASTGRIDMLATLFDIYPSHSITDPGERAELWQSLLSVSTTISADPRYNSGDSNSITRSKDIAITDKVLDSLVSLAGDPWMSFPDVTESRGNRGEIAVGDTISRPYQILFDSDYWEKTLEKSNYPLRHKLIEKLLFNPSAPAAIRKIYNETGFHLAQLAMTKNRHDLLDELYKQDQFDVNMPIRTKSPLIEISNKNHDSRFFASANNSETTTWLKNHGCDFSLKWKNIEYADEIFTDFFETQQTRSNFAISYSKKMHGQTAQNKLFLSNKFYEIMKAADLFDIDAKRLACVYRHNENPTTGGFLDYATFDSKQITPQDWILPFRGVDITKNKHILFILINQMSKKSDTKSETETKTKGILSYLAPAFSNKITIEKKKSDSTTISVGTIIMAYLLRNSETSFYAYYNFIKTCTSSFLNEIHEKNVLSYIIDTVSTTSSNHVNRANLKKFSGLILPELLFPTLASITKETISSNIDHVLKTDNFFRYDFLEQYLGSPNPGDYLDKMSQSQKNLMLQVFAEIGTQLESISQYIGHINEDDSPLGMLLQKADWPQSNSLERFLRPFLAKDKTLLQQFERRLLFKHKANSSTNKNNQTL